MNKIRLEDINSVIKDDLPWDRLRGKTFLVSGASGFIPSYVTEVLLNRGVEVIGIVRNLKKTYTKFPYWKSAKNLALIEHDVSNPLFIDRKIDYIIHAASQASPKYYGADPVGTLKANTLGCLYLLDIAVKNNIEKFIFFSSGEVYGTTDDSPKELKESYTGNVDITNVRSCYAESKRMGENMCVCYSYQFKIPVNMIRLSHIYGPGVALDDGRCFGDFVNDIVNNHNIVLNSDGSAKRSFLYITDMLKAMFRILFFGENCSAYNIASDKETSILELAQTLIDMYPEKKLKIEYKNTNKEGYIRSQSKRACFNIDKIEALGWKPKTDIKTGFKRMIESYICE